MSKKLGRNDLCLCGSGKKYKKCCLLKGVMFEEARKQKQQKNEFSFREYFKNFNTVNLVASIAALSIYPKNHGKNLRIEFLTLEALKSKSGAEKFIDINEFERVLNRYLPSHHTEDPPENIFTENIISSLGNNIVYGGNFEQGAFTLNNLIKVIEYNHNSFKKEFLEVVDSAIKIMLFVSDSIAKKLGHKRNMEGEYEESDSKIDFPLEIGRLRLSLYFSDEQLSRYCLDSEVFDQVLSWFTLSNEKIENSNSQIADVLNPIIFSPLLRIEGGYLVVSPTTIVSALVHFIWVQSEKFACKDILIEFFQKQIWSEVFLYLNKIGLEIENFKFESGSSLPIINVLYRIDSDKLLYLCFLKDEGDNYQTNTLFHYATNKHAISIENATKNILSNIKSRFDDSKILFLNLYSSIGRQYRLVFRKEKGIYSLVTTAFHFLCWIKSGNYEKMDLWYYCEAIEAFERKTVTAPFFGDFLNSFSFYKSKNFSFYLGDDKKPTHFGLLPGGALGVIKDAINNEDPLVVYYELEEQEHPVLLPVVKHGDYVPSYFSIENLGRHIEFFVPGYKFDLWIRVGKHISDMGSEEITIYRQLINAIAYWLWQVKDDLGNYFKDLNVFSVLFAFEIFDFKFDSDFDLNNKSESIVDQFVVDVDFKRVLIKIPPGILGYFSAVDNEGERILLSKILSAFKLLTQIHKLSNPINDRDIDQILELRAPIGLKKMLLFIHSSNFIQLDNRNLAKPRHIKEASKQKIMDITLTLLAEKCPPTGEIKTKEEKKKLVINIVLSLLGKLRSTLSEYNSIEILLHLMANYEAIIQENALLKLRTPTRLSCFKDHEDIVEKILEHNAVNDETATVCRCLIEHLSIEPIFGDRKMNIEVIDDICAIMSLIVFWGGLGDQINYDLFKIELSVLESGRIGTNSREIKEGFFKHFSRTRAEEYIDESIDSFSGHFSEAPNSDSNLAPSAFTKAFEKEFGITFAKLGGIVDLLVRIGFDQDTKVPRLWISDLKNLILKSFDEHFSDQEIDSAINFLRLWPWGNVLKIPNGFQSSDIHPWRHNRRLSYLQRPLIFIDYGEYTDKPSVFWTPRHLDHSWRYINYLIMSARYRAKEKSELEREISKVAKARSKVLQNEVVEWFKANTTCKILEEVGISPKGKLKNVKDLGDIDVLVIDETLKIMLSIECKRTEPASNSKQMVEELEQYYGVGKEKGYFQRHINRHEWLINRMPEITEALGIDNFKYTIYSFFITYEILAIQFIHDRKLPIKVIPLFEFKKFAYTKLLETLNESS